MANRISDIVLFKTRFVVNDLRECLSDEAKEKFDKLSESKQIELVEKHEHAISKGLEAGLMTEWTTVMSVAISCTDLEEDIENA
jgi:hypothetical protein